MLWGLPIAWRILSRKDCSQLILGGQDIVEGIQGTWADLIRNVNMSILLFYLLLDARLMFVY